MKGAQLLLGYLILSLLFSLGFAEPDWLSREWGYSKNISINSSVNVVDYQVKLEFPVSEYAGKMNGNGSDLRFFDDNGTALPFYVSDWRGNGTATVWVKVPELLVGVPKVITMYYGNPNAESMSNGEATFIFFESFENKTFKTPYRTSSVELNDSPDGGWVMMSYPGLKSGDGKTHFVGDTRYNFSTLNISLLNVEINVKMKDGNSSYTGKVGVIEQAVAVNDKDLGISLNTINTDTKYKDVNLFGIEMTWSAFFAQNLTHESLLNGIVRTPDWRTITITIGEGAFMTTYMDGQKLFSNQHYQLPKWLYLGDFKHSGDPIERSDEQKIARYRTYYDQLMLSRYIAKKPAVTFGAEFEYVNSKPVIVNISLPDEIVAYNSYNITVVATDADNDELNISSDHWLLQDMGSYFVLEPTVFDAGDYEANITVSDGIDFVIETINFTVKSGLVLIPEEAENDTLEPFVPAGIDGEDQVTADDVVPESETPVEETPDFTTLASITAIINGSSLEFDHSIFKWNALENEQRQKIVFEEGLPLGSSFDYLTSPALELFGTEYLIDVPASRAYADGSLAESKLVLLQGGMVALASGSAVQLPGGIQVVGLSGTNISDTAFVSFSFIVPQDDGSNKTYVTSMLGSNSMQEFDGGNIVVYVEFVGRVGDADYVARFAIGGPRLILESGKTIQSPDSGFEWRVDKLNGTGSGLLTLDVARIRPQVDEIIDGLVLNVSDQGPCESPSSLECSNRFTDVEKAVVLKILSVMATESIKSMPEAQKQRWRESAQKKSLGTRTREAVGSLGTRSRNAIVQTPGAASNLVSRVSEIEVKKPDFTMSEFTKTKAFVSRSGQAIGKLGSGIASKAAGLKSSIAVPKFTKTKAAVSNLAFWKK